MTASSPRGTFSQAELTTERAITGIIDPTGAVDAESSRATTVPPGWPLPPATRPCRSQEIGLSWPDPACCDRRRRLGRRTGDAPRTRGGHGTALSTGDDADASEAGRHLPLAAEEARLTVTGTTTQTRSRSGSGG